MPLHHNFFKVPKLAHLKLAEVTSACTGLCRFLKKTIVDLVHEALYN